MPYLEEFEDNPQDSGINYDDIGKSLVIACTASHLNRPFRFLVASFRCCLDPNHGFLDLYDYREMFYPLDPTMPKFLVVADELRPFLPNTNDLDTSDKSIVATTWVDGLVESGTDTISPTPTNNTAFSSDTDIVSPASRFGARSGETSHSHSPGHFIPIVFLTSNILPFRVATELPVWQGSQRLSDAAKRLLECDELQNNQVIPRELLEPFLERIPFQDPTTPKRPGRGSRNGAREYVCLWNFCGHKSLRKDHGLDHVAWHVGSRPFECPVWYVRPPPTYRCLTCCESSLKMLRMADWKRHIKTIHRCRKGDQQ